MESDKQSKGIISHSLLIAIFTASWYVTSAKNAVAMQKLVQHIREMATTKTQDGEGIVGPIQIVVLAVMVTFLQFLAGVFLCAPVVLFSSPWNGTRNRTLPRYANTSTMEQSSSPSAPDATIETKPWWSYLLVGSLHFIGCLCTNHSFGYGSASLVQVVKLLEPIETLLLTILVNQLLLRRSHGVTLQKPLSVLVIVTGTSMVLAQKSMKPNVVPVMMVVGSGCEVIVGSASKCLPTSVPVLPILLRAILYCLQYLQSFPPIVRLFYLTFVYFTLHDVCIPNYSSTYHPTRITYLPI